HAAANLRDYVQDGGHLAMSFFSGIVDAEEHILLGGYPAPLADLLGVRVIDWFPLPADTRLAVRFEDGSPAEGELWSELIEPAGAEVLATFAAGSLAARPAVTRNHFGKGTATYLGTRLDRGTMSRLLRLVCGAAGVNPVIEAPPGVEAVSRGEFTFRLNHGDSAANVELGPEKGGTIQFGARDVAIELTRAGISWRAHMDGMTDAGCVDRPLPYDPGHNPFACCGGACPSRVVPISGLAGDLGGKTPRFSWITPYRCHDTHDCDVSVGDAWLRQQVDQITASDAWKSGGGLFITWDEHDSNVDTRALTLVMAPGRSHGSN